MHTQLLRHLSTLVYRRSMMLCLAMLSTTACQDDTAISVYTCETSTDCPMPLFCHYGECRELVYIDADGDGVPEEDELSLGLNPNDADTDGDGASDLAELSFDGEMRSFTPSDEDGDGLNDAQESSIEDQDDDGYSDQEDPCNDDPDCPTVGGRGQDCRMQVGEICVFGLGACEQLGVIACAEDGRNAVCAGEPIEANEELCDGVDNDCDGSVDENFGDVGSICRPGVGACRRQGVFNCVDPYTAMCSVQAAEPMDEKCDSTDNDCDGRIDEDFAIGATCESGEGTCLREGVVACDDAQELSRCIPTVIDDVEERCDGADNDCDGLTDEGFESLGSPCESGTDACTVTGVLACDLAGFDLICSVATSDPTEELCNDLDDDCDGQIDERFPMKDTPCGGGEGLCAFEGTLTCNDDGSALVCSSVGATAENERCDGQDNDCDGQIDEAFTELGTPCQSGVGACEREGVYACDEGLGVLRCTARAGFGSTERCNGIDDDCDNSVDEGFAGVGEMCETSDGSCRFSGITQCENESSDIICVAMDPLDGIELCDGRDDDCDGQIDEGHDLGAPCMLNTGGCERDGTTSCANDGTAFCSANPLPNIADICDELDNDCDGRIDEDFPTLNQPCSVGTGACVGFGTLECSTDGLGVVCNAVESTPATDDVCDGIDNDCDGIVDNDYPERGNICFNGQSMCRTQGQYICNDQKNALICDAIAGAPAPELCNGLDDDCNGTADDPFPELGQRCTTGFGACETSGSWHCNAEGTDVECRAVDAPQPTQEVCDDRDNDCDGVIDEDFGPACRVRALDVSAGAYHTCFINTNAQIRCFGDSPSQAPLVTASNVSGSGENQCAITTDGTLRCWGDSQALTVPPTGGFSQVSVGFDENACALRDSDNHAVCWGMGMALTTAPELSFTRVGVGEGWACGQASDDGGLHCWGTLPNGTIVPSDTGFSSLSVGGSTACAINASGAIECFGADANMQAPQTPPVGSYTAVTLGPYLGCAVDATQKISCWELGSSSQPDAGQTNPPDAVQFEKLAIGNYHVCGIRSDDSTLTCWGAGSPGQAMGEPTNAGQATPP